jgi:hypothetical protein
MLDLRVADQHGRASCVLLELAHVEQDRESARYVTSEPRRRAPPMPINEARLDALSAALNGDGSAPALQRERAKRCLTTSVSRGTARCRRRVRTDRGGGQPGSDRHPRDEQPNHRRCRRALQTGRSGSSQSLRGCDQTARADGRLRGWRHAAGPSALCLGTADASHPRHEHADDGRLVFGWLPSAQSRVTVVEGQRRAAGWGWMCRRGSVCRQWLR